MSTVAIVQRACGRMEIDVYQGINVHVIMLVSTINMAAFAGLLARNGKSSPTEERNKKCDRPIYDQAL